jgi:hypothetical protein
MRCEELTREQADALKQKLRPMLRYLVRLKRRMTYKQFPPGDSLLRAVLRAESAMHELHVEVHYLSCGDVVGRPAKRHDEAEHGGEQA